MSTTFFVPKQNYTIKKRLTLYKFKGFRSTIFSLSMLVKFFVKFFANKYTFHIQRIFQFKFLEFLHHSRVEFKLIFISKFML